MGRSLALQLDGVEYVRVDEVDQVVWAWNGSHTVNAYAYDGTALDCFTFGFEIEDKAELRRTAIRLMAERVGEDPA